jgi:hypothetical protein
MGQAVLALGDEGAEGNALRGVTVRWCRAAHRPQSEARGAAAQEEEEAGMAGGQAAQGAAAAVAAFDVVVCTLPLGVLQAGARHGARAPALLLPRGAVRVAPDVFAVGSARRGALLRLGMGVENKVWLRFALAARPGGGGALLNFPGWPAGAVYVVPVEDGGGGSHSAGGFEDRRRYGKFLNLEAAMRAHAAVVPPPSGGGRLGLGLVSAGSRAAATAEEAEEAAERLEAEARRARGVVLAWPTPRWARQMEEMAGGCGMDDDAVGADAAAALLRALGVAAAAAPALVGVTCSRWGADPYARGSYSFVKAGSSVEDYAALAEPAWPVAREGAARGAAARHRLRFAGEATSTADSYTVHGAWASGEREARALLDEWRGGDRRERSIALPTTND